ncbi:PadR family transcriptional regulator [Streptomyces hydrogenans]|uniref:PadR family transcriptional regulator n=1 Tax=Streptomyces hydrogenans TaxID=1873719 RepID=A0ABQ3P337_9ACTN|nr:PadR family transcriptional regulator [Streptomyces hydrogenans]GHG27004.1 PadR family transcriptional regulator [Streptomyces hydrogenans]GHI19442.1 PadR family transcriptional regulator [Streptomyces hydrogenans]
MSPVFAHGRLRLYLLKLLDEAPRHGYEVIRLLEERFQGLYAPSAGTVYPRLAKLEAEGLVTHTSEGGRKVYSITDAGRAELAGRDAELDALEREIRDSVSELAAEIREDVRGAAGRVRSEMRAAASRSRTAEGGSFAEVKEELRKAKREWKEQARQAKEEARSATLRASEFQRVAQQVQDEVQNRFAKGDWPQAVRESLSGITAQLGDLVSGHPKARSGAADTPPADATPTDATPANVAPMDVTPPDAAGEAGLPSWAWDGAGSGDPARDLDRLLDRFRDEVRDAARDHGVTDAQLTEARHHLAGAAGRITGMLRPRAES